MVLDFLTPIVGTPSLETPFESPVLIFGLAMVVFLVAPLLLRRYRLPGIIGIILVGAAIGPNAIGLLERDASIQLLGEVGIIYLMFLAGLEINLNQFIEYKDRSIVFGLISFIIPQVVGTAVGVYLLDLTLAAASLFAAIFSSHTLLAYPVVNRLGIIKNEAMTATVGGTILTDTLALLVLAVVIAATDGALTTAFWVQLIVGLSVFFVGSWIVVPRVGRWFFRTHSDESYFEFLFVMAVLFTLAFLAELVGVEHIIGAFLAGLALNRLIPESGPLMNRIEFVGNALFIPFFLLSVGMLVNVRVLFEGAATFVIAASLLVMVFLTKFAAAWVTGQLYNYTPAEVGGMFGLSVGQAAAALAIVQIGFDAGVPGFDQNMINGVVLMILVVSLLSPAIVARAGSRIVEAEQRTVYDPTATPRRILVPISHESKHTESLLDLALAIRDSTEPLHILTVVQPELDRSTEATVATAEATHEEIQTYVSGAEVDVVGHTRINNNIASGIANSATENRISTISIGWDGARSRVQSTFGHTIDQVLVRTAQLTVVSHLRQPLNTADRLVVILPPRSDHSAGFYEAVHTIKQLAEQTGAPIYGLAVNGSPDQFRRLFELVEPDAPTSFDATSDWDGLLEWLRDESQPTDLVVCLSARRDGVSWHDELQTLPKRISTLTHGNFVVVYPAKAERADDRRFLRFS